MDTLATLQVYKELADWYERQGQAAMRDRFLILAAEAAFSAGKADEAERLRQRLLQGNPHHMLKPFGSFAQALQSSNVQIYVHDLQVNYPPETAENLLQNLRSGTDSTTAVPQTAPLIEIRDEPTLPLGGAGEALKVYPLREEPASPATPPPANPTPLNRPASRKQPTALPPTRPQPAVPVSSIPARPSRPAAAPIPPPPPPPEPAAPGGAWLALLLFGMTVTAGAALAVYTLARPFLPPQWLP
ncbi:MAG TPA: hypothetical protein VH682_15225 [Gemmataceae bacterium]|jgi:hypothetical protein